MANHLKNKNKNLLEKTNEKKSNSNKQEKQSQSSLYYQNGPNNLDANKTQQKSYNWEIIITKPSPSRKSTSSIHSSDTDKTETSSSSTSTQNSAIPVRVRSRTRSPHPAQKRKSESEHKSNRPQDLKLPQKKSKTEHHLDYTNQDALNWLKNKIAEQTTTQKKKTKKLLYPLLTNLHTHFLRLKNLVIFI